MKRSFDDNPWLVFLTCIYAVCLITTGMVLLASLSFFLSRQHSPSAVPLLVLAMAISVGVPLAYWYRHINLFTPALGWIDSSDVGHQKYSGRPANNKHAQWHYFITVSPNGHFVRQNGRPGYHRESCTTEFVISDAMLSSEVERRYLPLQGRSAINYDCPKDAVRACEEHWRTGNWVDNPGDLPSLIAPSCA